MTDGKWRVGSALSRYRGGGRVNVGGVLGAAGQAGYAVKSRVPYVAPVILSTWVSKGQREEINKRAAGIV